jgi:O-antigen/teichoic acid export membrane protein
MSLKLTHRFFWNSLNSVGITGLKLIVGLLVTPLLIAMLGPQNYGFYALVIGLMEMSLTLDFGFSQALTKELGASYGKQSQNRAREILTIGWRFYTVLAVILIASALLSWPILHFYPDLLPVTWQHPWVLQIALLVGGIYLYNLFFKVVLNAHCLHQWNSVADLINYSFGNLLGLLMVSLGFGLTGFFLSRLFTATLVTFFLRWQASRAEPLLRQAKAPTSPGTLKEMIHLNSHVLVIQFGYLLSYNLDVFLLGSLLTMSSVTLFDVLMKPLALVFQLVAQAGKGMLPLFSYTLAEQEKATSARKYFLTLSSLVNGLGLTLLLCLGCFYGEVVSFFSSNNFHWKDIQPGFLFAMLATWMTCLQMPATLYLLADSDQSFLSKTTLAMGVSNLLLSFWLIHPLGYLGAILGTVIPQFVQQQLLLIPRACRKLNITYLEYLWDVHFKTLPLALFTLLWLLGFRQLVSHYLSLNIGIILGICFSALCSTCFFYLLVLAPQEQKQFVQSRLSVFLDKQKLNPQSG